MLPHRLDLLSRSFNNFTLQYVDASMYQVSLLYPQLTLCTILGWSDVCLISQVARGLVLPLTVLLTFVLQASPPSKMAAISCGVVTLGFFIGVGWDRVGGGNSASAISG
jgi:GDP-fucose transporter C1